MVVSEVWVVITEGVCEVEVDTTDSVLRGSDWREDSDRPEDEKEVVAGGGVDDDGTDEEGEEVEDVRIRVLDGDERLKWSLRIMEAARTKDGTDQHHSSLQKGDDPKQSKRCEGEWQGRR